MDPWHPRNLGNPLLKLYCCLTACLALLPPAPKPGQVQQDRKGDFRGWSKSMGFDLFFVRSRSRDEMVEKTNPFTREVMSVRLLEPSTDSELRAVREVLRTAGAPEPDRYGYSMIQFGDGGAAEVHTSGLEEGCGVTLREGLSPDCLRFLFDLLRATEWVMLPAMEGNPAIVTSTGLAGEFAGNFPEVVCGSPEELGTILSGGYDEWKRYRDQVVGDGR